MFDTNNGKEIYKYIAPWPIYSASWNTKPRNGHCLAIGSFIEEYCNKIQTIELEENSAEFMTKVTFEHPYPPTKLMWIPDLKGLYPNLLASSGDYLRIWKIDETATLESLLNTNKDSDFCAPITSFDWNEMDPNLIGTASIDTTCTIWSLETGQEIGKTKNALGNNMSASIKIPSQSDLNPLYNSDSINGSIKTQIIAHDREVFDFAFSGCAGGRDMFATAGADASIRVFDLRHLEHSTIIYEHPNGNALVRLGWNREDPNYLAVLPSLANEILILDIRMPLRPAAAALRPFASPKMLNQDTNINEHLMMEQHRHEACINAFAWAPHSSSHICTASDDKQAIIWDICKSAPQLANEESVNFSYINDDSPVENRIIAENGSPPLSIIPILAYTAEGEINQVQWSAAHLDWISICYDNCFEMLRV